MKAAAFLFLQVLLAGLPGVAFSTPAAAAAHPPAAVQQLRIYEIFEHNKAAFHERFRDHAVRISRKYDFTIVAMWETKLAGRTEFAYILQWPDEQVMADRWKRFLADPEWIEIKRQTGAQHGRLVGEIQDRVLRLTDYSPPL
jgi:hypothetical protein